MRILIRTVKILARLFLIGIVSRYALDVILSKGDAEAVLKKLNLTPAEEPQMQHNQIMVTSIDSPYLQELRNEHLRAKRAARLEN